MLSGLAPLVTEENKKNDNNKLEKNKIPAAQNGANASRCDLFIAKKQKNQSIELKTPIKIIQSHCSKEREYNVGTCPKINEIKKHAKTMKKDFRVALVKTLALLVPKRLNNVLPAEASNARNANKIYSTIHRILLFNQNKRPTQVSLLLCDY